MRIKAGHGWNIHHTMPTLTRSGSSRTLDSDFVKSPVVRSTYIMSAVACSEANATTQEQPGPGSVEGEMR
jgi:hypothetical protein